MAETLGHAFTFNHCFGRHGGKISSAWSPEDRVCQAGDLGKVLRKFCGDSETTPQTAFDLNPQPCELLPTSSAYTPQATNELHRACPGEARFRRDATFPLNTASLPSRLSVAGKIFPRCHRARL